MQLAYFLCGQGEALSTVVSLAREEAADSPTASEDARAIQIFQSFKRVSHVAWPTRDCSKANVLSLPTKLFGRSVSFMVDSGAERSVVPPSLIPSSLIFPTTTQLSGADGSAITTIGQCTCRVAVKELRREFVICFVVAKTQPILGADFLTNNKLSLNMQDRKLIDNVTHISTTLHPTNTKQTLIRATGSDGSNSFLAENFPTLLHAPDYTSLPSTPVCHAIETKGPPVFCKPRPLSPAKTLLRQKVLQSSASLDHCLQRN